MDVSTLEKMVEDDLAASRTPLMIIGNVGTSFVGHVDNISRLSDICKKNSMHLHLEGYNLAMIMFEPSIATFTDAANVCDSMTLNLGLWLGVPAVPPVTLYRRVEASVAHAAGLLPFQSRGRLTVLPVWVFLQSLSQAGIVDRLKHVLAMAKLLFEKTSKVASIRNIVPFETENPTVVFKYIGKPNQEDTENQESSFQDSSYIDALNIWLTETLRREVPPISISIVELEQEGVCIRFAPLETFNVYDAKLSDVDVFVESLISQVSILDATLSQRNSFEAIVEAQDNIKSIHLPNWAGLGAIQYLPNAWIGVHDQLPDNGKIEVNNLNSQLVHQLKSSDTAFSLGQTADGLSCVRFGLITTDTDLEELIALVYATGKEVEESSKYLEKMAEVVRTGIEQAKVDLHKENQDKLLQEGVLRQVPLVGSFVNWLSPPPKDANIKGRAFDLASGKIESTESTYKYRMQIQDPVSDKPPQALASSPASLKAVLKPVRNRTTSSTSVDTSRSLTKESVENSNESETNPASEARVDSQQVDSSVESSTAAQSGVPENAKD